MHKKRYSFLSLGLGAVGAALLLNGCGGGSFEKTSYGTYQNALPAAYGIEATAANGNISGPQGPFFYETSGLGSADGHTAYLAAASDFAIVKNPNGATLLAGVDPNSTGKVPLGFSSGVPGALPTPGVYIDASSSASPAIPAAVAPGAQVVFRAAISNGVSSSARSTIPITYNGVSLSSADSQWTLGTLPLTFNYLKTGPFANATYVTGTPVASGQGTPTPFAVPFTTTGIHPVVLTVNDDAGQQTATTFEIPVVAAADSAALINITATVPAGSPSGTTATVTSATATITNPISGATAQTTADTQGNVLLFAAPGAQTVSVTAQVILTSPTGQTSDPLTQTGTLPVTLTPGGTVLTTVATS